MCRPQLGARPHCWHTLLSSASPGSPVPLNFSSSPVRRGNCLYTGLMLTDVSAVVSQDAVIAFLQLRKFRGKKTRHKGGVGGESLSSLRRRERPEMSEGTHLDVRINKENNGPSQKRCKPAVKGIQPEGLRKLRKASRAPGFGLLYTRGPRAQEKPVSPGVGLHPAGLQALSLFSLKMKKQREASTGYWTRGLSHDRSKKSWSSTPPRRAGSRSNMARRRGRHL